MANKQLKEILDMAIQVKTDADIILCGSFVSLVLITQKTIWPGSSSLTPCALDTILQFGGKILDTLTRLHFSIPAFLRASSRDCSFSLCLPTPFVKKIFFGTDCILFIS